MTIGIDLDDTLIETTKTGNKYLKEFITDNSITDYHDLSKDEYLKFYKVYLYDIQKCAPIKKDALKVLNYLHSKNIRIVFITARGTLGFTDSIPITLELIPILFNIATYISAIPRHTCDFLNISVFSPNIIACLSLVI